MFLQRMSLNKVDPRMKAADALEGENRATHRHHTPHQATIHRQVVGHKGAAIVVVRAVAAAVEAEGVEGVVVADEAVVAQGAGNSELEKLIEGER